MIGDPSVTGVCGGGVMATILVSLVAMYLTGSAVTVLCVSASALRPTA
jgi:hypothetical protein